VALWLATLVAAGSVARCIVDRDWLGLAASLLTLAAGGMLLWKAVG